MAWAESDLDVGGVRLHVYRTGRGTTPLVLAHGMTDNGRCFDRLVAELADHYDIVAYDARNHGRSDTADTSTSTLADDLVVLVRTLGLDRPFALGHSMGAATVAVAASNHPHLFRAIVLEDPPWGDMFVPKGEPDEATKANQEAMKAAFEAMRERQRTQTFESVLAEGRAMSPTWHDDEFPAWVEAKLQFRMPDLSRSGGALAQFPAWRPIAEALRVPTLLVIGNPAKGCIVSPDLAAEAREACPTLEVAAFDAGHNVRREDFSAFVDTVSAFLAAHAA